MKKIPIKNFLSEVKDEVLKELIVGCCNPVLEERYGIQQLREIVSKIEK